MTIARPVLDILQLTDPHLFADPETRLKGVETASSFRRALDHALAAWNPDVILLTGDLSEDRSPEAYLQLRKALEPLQIPVYCIPGNHDDPEILARELRGRQFHYCRPLRHQNWLLPMLNTWDGDRGGGRLGEDELDKLSGQLASSDAEHVLVCLHHQPVPVGSAWLDSVGLDDSDDLMAVIERFPRVRGLLWGHVHQAFDQHNGGLRLMGTPSTCYQFEPRRDDFALDGLGPGYRRLRLHADGRIESQVTQLDP
jgi:Icc protein